jgi:tetratricopeptide (TPR) repeat protein
LQNITETVFELEENEDLWQEIRRKSLAYDLLKYDKSSKLFNTHRLIQKVIQIRQNDDEQKEIILAIISAIDKLFDYSRHETKANCELYTPHALSITEKTEKIGLSSEAIARIYEKIGRHLRETLKYEDSVVYFNKAITYLRNLPEKEQEEFATCLNELAIVYRSQGKYEKAIELHKQSLEIGEKTIGKEHPDYAISYRQGTS